MDYTPNKDSKNHMEKNEEYIRVIEEKNRLKKMAEAKSIREKQEEARERANTSSKPVLAKPMVKTNQSIKTTTRPKGERKGWAIEPPNRGNQKSTSDRMGGISPILQPRGSRVNSHVARDSLEAVEVDDDHQLASRVARVSTDDAEISEEDASGAGEGEGEEDNAFEDSLEEEYEGRMTYGTSSTRHTTSLTLHKSHDFEVEEELYDEDFEDEDTDDTKPPVDQEEEEEEEVSFRPARWRNQSSSCQTPEKKQVGMPMSVIEASPIEAESVPSVRKTSSASSELKSLSAQYRESTTRERAVMRDRLEDSVVRGVGGGDKSKSGSDSSGQEAQQTWASSCVSKTGNSDSSVADTIASRLQSLSAEQQSQLLMMLNKLEGSPSPPEDQLPSTATQVAATSQAQVALNPKRGSRPLPLPLDTNEASKSSKDTDRLATPPDTPSKSKKRRSPRRKKNSPARPQNSSNQGSVFPPQNVAGPPCEAGTGKDVINPSIEVSIRIKLHNSWKRTKLASLASLRLLVRGSDEEVDLSQFSVQVSTGNTTHPKTSEVVRGVSYLFLKSRVAERKEWRFPVGSSTQLILTGHLTGPPEDYELLVWNGSTDITCSPVQDIDVYTNNALVWTGVIEDDSVAASLDSTMQTKGGLLRATKDYTSRLLLTSHGLARSPSTIIPLCPQLAASRRETVKTTVSPISKSIWKDSSVQETGRRDVGLDLAGVTARSESSFTFSGLSNASSTGMSTTDFQNMEHDSRVNRSKETPAEPSWVTDVLSAPSDGPLSARINSDITFVEPSRLKPSTVPRKEKEELSVKSLDVFYADEAEPSIGSRPGSRRQLAAARTQIEERSTSQGSVHNEPKPASRGSRRKAQEQEAIAQQGPVTTPFKPRKSRRETKKEEEEKLRQSLEALNASDRHNRGRLEQELTTASAGRFESSGGTMPKISESSDGSELSVDMTPMSLEATVAVNLSNRRMRALEELTGGVLDNELVGDRSPGGGQRKVLRQRSERINQVQEKVTTALASLAGMMATLPGQSRQQQPPEHATLNLSPIHKNAPSFSVTTEPSAREIVTDRPSDVPEAPLDDGIDDILAESYLDSSVFEIPVLPKGRIMEVEVLSTWGDPYYVGLNGIDIFDHHGDILLLNEGIESIEASPSDINILGEYNDDPRTIANVLDGVNFTRDDLHVWLTPHGHTLTPRLPYAANITIALSKFTSISLIRIWNYNKSRTHCYRGVRRCRIKLDNRVVFEGEIRAAPGLVTSCEDCSEVILFTTDSVILSKVAAYDASMGYLSGDLTEHETNAKWMEQLKGHKAYSRPRTADKNSGTASAETSLSRRKQASVQPEGPFEPTQTRPVTAAIRPAPAVEMNSSSRSLPADLSSNIDTRLPPSMSYSEPLALPLTGTMEVSTSNTQLKRRDLFECKVLSFVIEQTWGDKCYVGLAGIEVLIGQNCIPTEIDPNMVDAEPRDLSAIGCFDDPRTPDKLVNGINDTTDDKNMWLIPYTAGTTHKLKLDLGAPCAVAGFNIWNYNKSPEDALRGVRVMSVYADGKFVGRCEIRMALGCDGVTSKQTIMLRDITHNELRGPVGLRYITPSVKQDYETLVLPSGTCWRFNLYCNWGDGYYIGLDGLQMLDERGKELLLESSHSRIVASPESLCDLGMQDSRLPRNLSSAPFHDPSGGMAWLAPLAQCMTVEERRDSLRYTVGKCPDKDFEPLFYDHNILCVMFDRPVSVSAIRFFNYSKSPKRGVREMSIDVDGNVVFMGTLRASDSQGYKPTDGHAVVFTSDPKITQTEKAKTTYCGGGEQDVLCINERQVIVRSKAMYEQPNVSMEGIYSDLTNRPTTSLTSTA